MGDQNRGRGFVGFFVGCINTLAMVYLSVYLIISILLNNSICLLILRFCLRNVPSAPLESVTLYIRTLCTEISYHTGDAFECSTARHVVKLVMDMFSLEYAGNREAEVCTVLTKCQLAEIIYMLHFDSDRSRKRK